MDSAIWKYILEPDTITKMPKGSEVLSVHVQGNSSNVCLWAMVDVQISEIESRRFVVYATGQVIPETELSHLIGFIGTVMLHDGLLVFHVFERTVDD